MQEKGGFVLTFDDDYVEQWYSIRELLNTNSVKATFFVSNFHRLTNHQIELLQILQNDGHEIASHSYSHRDAKLYLTNHTLNQYVEEEILPSVSLMSQNNIIPVTFSYPYGNNCDSLDNKLLSYFILLRDVTEEQRTPLTKHVNEIDEIFCKFDNSKIVSALGIDNIFNISYQELIGGLTRAKENNEAIVFYVHEPVPIVNSSYQTSYEYLGRLIEEAKKMNLKSYRFSDLAN